MKNNSLVTFVDTQLDELCHTIGPRPVGSSNNQKAAAYVGSLFQQQGCDVEYQQFDCFDWKRGDITLRLGDTPIKAAIADYSVFCDVIAPYETIGTVEQLERAELSGKIVVLHGDLTKEALMPKNFPFYNPEEHQKIVGLLETKNPVAVIAVSFHDTRPVPIIEDGDFLIPCATVAKNDSLPFFEQTDTLISLKMDIRRLPSTGANVIARIQGNEADGKIILMSHLDTKPNTPGAIDNATGIAIQFLINQLMGGIPLKNDIEFLVFNGEDTFGTPGELAYLEKYGDFSGIQLAINCDGVGYKDAKTGVAYMGCSEQFVTTCESKRQQYSSLEQMEPWYQSDHSIFFQQGVPTLALTTPLLGELTDAVTHTEHDRPDIVNPQHLIDTAQFLYRIIRSL